MEPEHAALDARSRAEQLIGQLRKSEAAAEERPRAEHLIGLLRKSEMGPRLPREMRACAQVHSVTTKKIVAAAEGRHLIRLLHRSEARAQVHGATTKNVVGCTTYSSTYYSELMCTTHSTRFQEMILENRDSPRAKTRQGREQSRAVCRRGRVARECATKRGGGGRSTKYQARQHKRTQANDGGRTRTGADSTGTRGVQTCTPQCGG